MLHKWSRPEVLSVKGFNKVVRMWRAVATHYTYNDGSPLFDWKCASGSKGKIYADAILDEVQTSVVGARSRRLIVRVTGRNYLSALIIAQSISEIEHWPSKCSSFCTTGTEKPGAEDEAIAWLLLMFEFYCPGFKAELKDEVMPRLVAFDSLAKQAVAATGRGDSLSKQKKKELDDLKIWYRDRRSEKVASAS